MSKECKNRQCKNIVISKKQYCCDRCKYWENVFVKDDEKNNGLMPKNKRNKNWFWFYEKSSYSKGQGKRCGHMIVGALSGIPVPSFSIREFNKTNLDLHFSKSMIGVAVLGDSTRVTKEMYEIHGLNCIEYSY